MDVIRASTNLATAFQIALDGAEAINYLRGRAEYCDRSRYPLPDLILTQIDLPGISGLALLAWIKRQPQFQTLPVVLIQPNLDSHTIHYAEQLGAHLLIPKPISPASSLDFSRQVLDVLRHSDAAYSPHNLYHL